MSDLKYIETLERENVLLRDLIHDMFRLFHVKKEIVNEILRGRAEGVALVSEEEGSET